MKKQIFKDNPVHEIIKSKYKWQRYFIIDDRPLGEGKIEMAHLWNDKKSLCGLKKESNRSGIYGKKYLNIIIEQFKKDCPHKICQKCLEGGYEKS